MFAVAKTRSFLLEKALEVLLALDQCKWGRTHAVQEQSKVHSFGLGTLVVACRNCSSQGTNGPNISLPWYTRTGRKRPSSHRMIHFTAYTSSRDRSEPSISTAPWRRSRFANPR